MPPTLNVRSNVVVRYSPARAPRAFSVLGIQGCTRLLCWSTAITLMYLTGCTNQRDSEMRASENLYPPAPAVARIAALGNLRVGPAATTLNREISVLLLGTEPEPTLGLLKPTTIAIRNDELLICDSVLHAILTWNPSHASLSTLTLHPNPDRPVAAQTTPTGELLVVDAGAGQVIRYDAAGQRVRSYTRPSGVFRPAYAIQVNDEIWVSDVGSASVERFDAADGHWIEAMRGPPTPNAPFVMPYGLARTPSGEVLVVDMLAPTVHVFAADGTWRRRIGAAGDRPGYFGRPKYAAAAPDGTIFISDAGLQCIHVFDAKGQRLMAFGNARQSENRLTVPAGLAIASDAFIKYQSPPDGFRVDYAVLGAEQITNPGVRTFAWGEGRRTAENEGPISSMPPTNSRGTVNPHWSTEGCKTCHAAAGPPQAIAVAAAQTLCLTCHDGLKATQEFHPVDRVANRGPAQTPADWPVLNGRLTCLTCHDIMKHCTEKTARPDGNALMLRAFDAATPFAICLACHKDQSSPRINPHRTSGDAKRDAATCNFCHSADLKDQPGGQRSGQTALRVESSALCLTCHARHWDYFPGGHVERPIPATIGGNLARPVAADGAVLRTAGSLKASDLLPTVNGRVVCYTCHNPHRPEAYPPQSPLGLRSGATQDERFNFRLERTQLCFTCHNK